MEVMHKSNCEVSYESIYLFHVFVKNKIFWVKADMEGHISGFEWNLYNNHVNFTNSSCKIK